MTTEHDKALSKAKIQFMTKPDSAFFFTVCFSLKHAWDDTIPTAQTNGLEIRYNPDFFMSLNKNEQVGLLLHETLHVALLHMNRLRDKDQRKANIAADYVVNGIIKGAGFKLPEGALYDPVLSHDHTMEQVYDLLPDVTSIELPMDDLEEPGTGGGEESTGQDTQSAQQAAKELQEQVEEILVRAATQSKMMGDKPGSIPGEIQIFLDGLLKPKLPWRVILARYMRGLSKTDHSFRKPNRRYWPEYHMPSMHSEGLDHIAIAVDTSGSVTNEEFRQFISETTSIFRAGSPTKISFVQFDSSIKSVDVLRNLSDLQKIEFRGRGGTDVNPVIQWTKENKPHVMVIFTDGMFSNQSPDPGVPVVWIITNNKNYTAPYGKVINYKLE